MRTNWLESFKASSRHHCLSCPVLFCTDLLSFISGPVSSSPFVCFPAFISVCPAPDCFHLFPLTSCLNSPASPLSRVSSSGLFPRMVVPSLGSERIAFSQVYFCWLKFSLSPLFVKLVFPPCGRLLLFPPPTLFRGITFTVEINILVLYSRLCRAFGFIGLCRGPDIMQSTFFFLTDI